MQTCLIADDHEMMREALAGAVALGWPATRVTLAVDYHTAFAAAASRPDLIISDLVMPGATPVEGIRRLREIAPDSPILVVTGDEDDATLLALFDLGIAGFAPKTSKSAVIEAAIGLIVAGGRYLPPRVIELASIRNGAAIAPTAADAARLTQRQVDVLERIAQGMSNKEIARELDLSPATVKAHTAAAMAALNAANRTDAAMKARERKLI